MIRRMLGFALLFLLVTYAVSEAADGYTLRLGKGYFQLPSDPGNQLIALPVYVFWTPDGVDDEWDCPVIWQAQVELDSTRMSIVGMGNILAEYNHFPTGWNETKHPITFCPWTDNKKNWMVTLAGPFVGCGTQVPPNQWVKLAEIVLRVDAPWDSIAEGYYYSGWSAYVGACAPPHRDQYGLWRPNQVTTNGLTTHLANWADPGVQWQAGCVRIWEGGNPEAPPCPSCGTMPEDESALCLSSPETCAPPKKACNVVVEAGQDEQAAGDPALWWGARTGITPLGSQIYTTDQTRGKKK